MSAQTLAMDLRRVLDAPRGRRFSHTPHRPGFRPGARPTPGPVPEPLPPLVSLGRTPRERELLAQMPDTPGLRRRMELGDLPEWMLRSTPPGPCWRQDQAAAPAPDHAPKPVRTPGEDTRPSRPLPVPHPRREQVPLPPLPRRSDRPRRPASHRKPRRRVGPLVAGYALAILTGAVSHHLLALLV